MKLETIQKCDDDLGLVDSRHNSFLSLNKTDNLPKDNIR
jgi:hypothetical protein